ncbi:glutathione S-transferase omega-like 2 [Wallemia mellicola]|uniref:Glutathione S-transferase omega-like 2 n=1 Tax=Wallemia mellicola TaxID=1708541 RepID=A0A4T0PI91_9BASI|nr:glutathione S-transferase omega-like 2 [Wallemia mellicola]TIB98970.1 glutathione S-transferase omega-like 2 [Wallemia mellicola]TIC10470.1 glutathione S-transferase omega-like 2 [Wallemia mellicola]TIC29216.1 glutathione S-transferase omega-like 2 [Wallemia mellicola]
MCDIFYATTIIAEKYVDINIKLGLKGRRQVSSFRDEIKAGGKFEPENNRYHLVVSYACPWAHRALIVRSLSGLEDFLPYSVVHPYLGEKGWSFDKDFEGATGCTIEGVDATHLRDLYFTAEKDYNARFTVPIIWDKKLKTIVSNESSEIIRFLNDLKPDVGGDIYPEHLRKEIDELNGWVYDTVNNGVYKSGFATTQEAYEGNVKPLFESLDRLEKILSDGRDFLIGGQLTEADIRLYTTIVRFDPVYVGHFKCNLGTIRHNYPHINTWLKKLYWKNDAFKSTTNFKQIKYHYYNSHRHINGTGVVPLGPNPDIEPL